MITKTPAISDYHDELVKWYAQGLSFQEMAERLRARNIPASKGRIYHHFVKHKFRMAEKPKSVFAGTHLEELEEGPHLAFRGHSITAHVAEVPRAKEKHRYFPPPAPTAPHPPSRVTPSVRSPAPPAAFPARFPDIDRHRKRILACIQVGCTTAEICATLGHTCGMRTTVERVGQYLTSVRRKALI